MHRRICRDRRDGVSVVVEEQRVSWTVQDEGGQLLRVVVVVGYVRHCEQD